MSELTDILTGRANVNRLTDILLASQAILGSLSVDRQPPKECRIRVEIVGATILTGLVNIAGNTNETLSFSGNGIKIGEKNFTSISGITTSGISDGFIEVKAVSRTGQPVNQEIVIYSNLPVRFYAQDGRIRMMPQGQQKIAKYKAIVAPGTPVQERDLIYVVSGIQGLTRGVIAFVEEVMDFEGATHHYEPEILEI